MFAQLTFEQWVERFKPMLDRDGQPLFFDTSFPEQKKVIQSTSNSLIWTETDDGDCDEIISGYHFVNRMGHYICSVLVEEDDHFFVILSVKDQDDEEEDEEEE